MNKSKSNNNDLTYYQLSITKIVDLLKTNLNLGLNNTEVNNRFTKFGYNELEDKNKVSAFKVFISQFKSSIIYILIFAVIISLLLGEIVDSIIIFIILILNSILGFVQEYNAAKSIEELKKLSTFKAVVLRNSQKKEIDSKLLVPGDIIYFEEGNKICADCRIIENNNLKVDESSLTGESVAVEKNISVISKESTISERKNMLFSGTLITNGTAKAIVVKTGMKSEIGKIANLISTNNSKKTPLQIKLDKLGKILAYIVIFVCIIIFITGVIKDNLHIYLFSGQFITFIQNAEVWLIIAVSLAVAAVPEGLPAVVTIALSIGVKKMLSKNALIRNLPSVETLGETNIICTDKTGTLTKNEMTVRRLFLDLKEYELDGTGYSKIGNILEPISRKKEIVSNILFKIGILANNSDIEKEENLKLKTIGDPTEISLLISSFKNNIDFRDLREANPRILEIPFSSNRKLMSSINRNLVDNKEYIYTKGAPEKILDICTKILINGKIKTLTKEIKENILNKNKEFSLQALRVLGFSYKDINSKKISSKNKNLEYLENEEIFVGLQAMIDPPRLEVKDSIIKCKNAGIRVIMITGDNSYTAQAIANEVGILGTAIDGSDFFKFEKSKQIKLIAKIGIFSRVEPEHKLKIVKLLQEQGFTVAMSGDGVNDAPAIKQADLGIAMGLSGSDVTKSSSDMILLDDKFNTIVNSIEEGRGIYENIKKFVNYLLSSNIAEVLIVFFAIIFGWSLPMTAIMLLWLNLVTDGFPALALSLDPNPKYLMNLRPKGKKENIITKNIWISIILISVIISIVVLYLFKTNLVYGLDIARTMAFTSLVVIELVRPFDIRKDFKLGIFSNLYLVGAVIISFILQLIVIYTPLNKLFGLTALSFNNWLIIILSCVVVYTLNYICQKIFKLNNNLYLHKQ